VGITQLRIKKEPLMNSSFMMKVLKHFREDSIVFLANDAGTGTRSYPYGRKINIDPYLPP